MIEVILATIGTLALIKGLFILIFEKHAIKLATKMLKKPKNLRKFATWEVIIALLVLIVASFI
jgi:uncharacterized protein YjeT (DUF2065 family)